MIVGLKRQEGSSFFAMNLGRGRIEKDSESNSCKWQGSLEKEATIEHLPEEAKNNNTAHLDIISVMESGLCMLLMKLSRESISQDTIALVVI